MGASRNRSSLTGLFEDRTRREMTDAYKRQKENSDGFDDWGKFTDYVVRRQTREIARLRLLAEAGGIDTGIWADRLAA